MFPTFSRQEKQIRALLQSKVLDESTHAQERGKERKEDEFSGKSLADYLIGVQWFSSRVHLLFEAPPHQIPFLQTQCQILLPSLVSLVAPLEPHFGFTASVVSEKSSFARKDSTSPDLSLSPLKNKTILCVASGKGGVGKSTTTVNLGIAFTQLGYSVGLVDADIYGPSLPTLLQTEDTRSAFRPHNEGGELIPLTAYGMEWISMGSFIEPGMPVAWRGPKIQGAVLQLLKGTRWTADLLIVDMPPGTGDIPLTLAQNMPIAGAVIVSTPQDLALMDAIRAAELFKKLKIPLWGLIENMSGFECPQCGHLTPIFHQGGAQKEAEERGIPFLGALPLHLDLRLSGDAGLPLAIQYPDHPLTQIYREMAQRLMAHTATDREM